MQSLLHPALDIAICPFSHISIYRFPILPQIRACGNSGFFWLSCNFDGGNCLALDDGNGDLPWQGFETLPGLCRQSSQQERAISFTRLPNFLFEPLHSNPCSTKRRRCMPLSCDGRNYPAGTAGRTKEETGTFRRFC